VALHHRVVAEEQLLLVEEVPEQRPLPDVGRLRDLGQGDGLEASRREQLERCLRDRRPGALLLALAERHGTGHPRSVADVAEWQ